MDEMRRLGALEQAAAIRRREIAPSELLALYQARIERHNSALSALVEAFPRAALREARAAKIGEGAPLFAGVPTAIKDTDPVRFGFNRAGSRAYKLVWSPVDGPAVSLLRRAGLVIAGKTSTSELALMPVVEPDIHPPTRNPWNLAHSAGGSSGGAAAAVAAGLLPIAHAADGAGSIRIPAALCHLYGFKASRGLTPNFYAAFDKVALSAVGALARTVADSAAAMDALCGRFGPPGADYLAIRCQQPPPRLRIRLCLESPLAPTDPRIAAGVEEVARVLESLGHRVEPCAPFQGTLDEFLPVFQRMAAASPALSEAHFQPITRWLRAAGRAVPLARAQAITAAIGARALAWFAGADLVLTPTTPRFAPRVREWDGLPPEDAFRKAADLGAFTALFNASGQPAASVPAGVAGPDALPFGAQLVGPAGGDELVLRVSRQLEQALDWNQRRSPLFDA